MKKLLSILLLCAAILFVFSSCNKKDDDDNEKDPDGGNDQVVSAADGIIWSPDINATIVTEYTTDEIKMLYDHIVIQTMKQPAIVSPEAKPAKNEIIIGDVGRELSDTAYSKLRATYDEFDLKENKKSAYYIYAKDGSIAVAYSDIYARDAALYYLVTFGSVFYVEGEGVVAKSSFETKSFVNDFREQQREEGFKNLELYLPEDAVDIIRNIYTLYDEDLYVWLANLYDPERGGFYYSQSARDTEGYLPDLESTAQALKIMENSGLADVYGGKWMDLLSDEMKAQLLDFARGLQRESDGYFYHPQWGTSISSNRRGRDAGWARDIIDSLGEEPYYPYASQRKSTAAAASLTGRLGSSISSAVSDLTSSKVTATASFSVASWDKLKAYLDEGLVKNSYSVGNTLNSNVTPIKNAGLWNNLLDYLRTHQFPNGLWEPTVSYNSVNGLMKMSSFFGSSFPNPNAAIESAIEVLKMDPSDEMSALTFVYNPWVAIYNVLPSCSKTDREGYERIFKDNAAEFFEKTLNKLALFTKDDGGFSMGQLYSSSTSQDALVAVENTPESDVNSTSIAISSVLVYMLQVYDVIPPKLYYKYDTMYFLDELAGLGAIIKDDLILEDPVRITFDEVYETDEDTIVGGVDTNPAYSVTNNIGDNDMEEGLYKWFFAGLVDNPAPKDPDTVDKVLHAGDRVYDVNGDGVVEDELIDKEMAIGGSNTQFLILNYGTMGNCYAFDGDLYVPAVSETAAPVLQIQFTRAGTSDISTWLNVYAYKKASGETALRIEENFTGRDGVKDKTVVTDIPTDEWFNLKIETYKLYNEENGKLEVKIKIYVNGKYAGSCDSAQYNSDDDEYYDRIISAVRFAYYRHTASSVYFNNMYVYKANRTYVDEILDADEELTVDSEVRVYDFENGIPENDENFRVSISYTDAGTKEVVTLHPNEWTSELEGVYGIGKGKGGIRMYSAGDYVSETNKVLKVYTANMDNSTLLSTMYIDDSVMSVDGKTYELAFDYYVESIPWIYNEKFFNIGFNTYKGARLYDISFNAIGWEESKKNPTGLVMKDAAGNVLSDFVMKIGAWYSFKIELYYDAEHYDSSRLKIFVSDKDGNSVCIADKVIALNKNGVISELALEYTPYKIRGTQYFDDISFARTDKEYTASGASLDGYVHPEIIDRTLNGESSYDFEEDEIKVGITGATHSTNKVDDTRIDAPQTSVTVGASRPSGYYGVFMSLTEDPSDAANRVLMMESVACGSSTSGTVTLRAAKESDSSSIHVIQYDYLFESNSAASATVLQLQFNDNTGAKIGSNATLAYNVSAFKKSDNVKKNIWQISTTSTSSCPADCILNSNTWYTVRVVYDSSKSSENMKYFISWDGGKTFKLAATNNRSASSVIDSVSLLGLGYNNTGVQYFDNVSYSILDTEPEYVAGEKPVEPEDEVTPPTVGTVLDFETDVGSDITELYTYSKASSGTPALQNSITATSTSATNFGILGQRVTNPSAAAGNVLKIVTNGGTNNSQTSNGGVQSKLILNPTSYVNGGKVHIVEFDFYLESITKNMRNPFELYAYDSSGEVITYVARNSSDSKYTSTMRAHTAVTAESKVENAFHLAQGTSAGSAESASVAMFDSHTWYRFRITWNQEDSNIYYEVSFDGGENYFLAFSGERKTNNVASENVHHLAFTFNHYGFGSVYYMDNINYKVTDTLPKISETLGDDSVEKN